MSPESGGVDRAVPPRAALPKSPAGAGVLALFAATTFLSAFLLFSIQPLFAKMVLPVLGGSSSVWAVALLFFQAALLAGYGYAHLLTRYVPFASSGFVHLGVAVLALLALPVGLPDDLARAAARRSVPLAARPLRRGGRLAVRRRRGECAAAAGVVLALGTPARAGSVLPLRRLQSRQPHRAARLPVSVRAGVRAHRAEPLLGAAVRRADRRHRRLLRARAAARRGAASAAAADRASRCRRADVAPPYRLVRPGARAGGAADGLHHAHRHRHRLGAAALGAAAGTLPVDVRARLPVALAAADVAAAAGTARRRAVRAAGAGADQARQMGAHRRRRRRGVLPRRPCRASDAVPEPAAGALSHRVLSVDVVRRRARRTVLRAHRPAHLHRGLRISAAHRAVARLPTRRLRSAGVGEDGRGVDPRHVRCRAAADLAGARSSPRATATPSANGARRR